MTRTPFISCNRFFLCVHNLVSPMPKHSPHKKQKNIPPTVNTSSSLLLTTVQVSINHCMLLSPARYRIKTIRTYFRIYKKHMGLEQFRIFPVILSSVPVTVGQHVALILFCYATALTFLWSHINFLILALSS